MTRNGHRHLLHNNYTYGELKVTDSMIWWRCTSNIRSGDTNKRKRCPVVLSTSIVDGLEMIKHTNVRHTHPPKTRKSSKINALTH